MPKKGEACLIIVSSVTFLYSSLYIFNKNTDYYLKFFLGIEEEKIKRFINLFTDPLFSLQSPSSAGDKI